MITDPQSKDAQIKDLQDLNLQINEVQVIKDFVNNGGSLIITSRADYDDKGADAEYENSVQGNRILEALDQI